MDALPPQSLSRAAWCGPPSAHLCTCPPAHLLACPWQVLCLPLCWESPLWKLRSQMGSEFLPMPLSWALTWLPPGSAKPGSVASSPERGSVWSWPDVGHSTPPRRGGPLSVQSLAAPVWSCCRAARGANLWPACVPAPGPSAGLRSLASWQELSYNYLSPLAEIAVTLRIGRWPGRRRGATGFPGPERRQEPGSVPPPCPPGFWVQSSAALEAHGWNQRQSGARGGRRLG